MITIDVKKSDVEAIRKAVRNYPKEMEKGVARATLHILAKAKENAPKSIGTLSRSHTFKVDGLTGRVYPTTQYAIGVHEGTKPHWIPSKEAKPGGSLYRWAKKKGANPWAVRSGIAKHGTRPQPWLEETADKEEGAVLKILSDEARKALKL
jgi:HK97 gp10 family phage protein